MRHAALAVSFASFLIFLLNQDFNYSIYLPSAYRIIHIPVYYWILCLSYYVITHKLFIGRRIAFQRYIGYGIITSFFVHIYLLLGNLIFELFKNPGSISHIYIAYIILVYLCFTAASAFTAARLRPLEDEAETNARLLVYPQFLMAASYFVLRGLIESRFVFALAVSCSIAAGAALPFLRLKNIMAFIRVRWAHDSSVAAAVFIFALSIRLLFGAVLVDKTTHGPKGYDGYLHASDDGLTYDATAVKLLKDSSILRRGEISLWGHWDESYSLLLAGVYKIFGRNFYALVVLQSIFGALIPVFIFTMGKMLFPRAAAIMAALAISLKGGVILLSAYMGHEAIWAPLLYLWMLLLTIYYKRAALVSLSNHIWTGTALGALMLFRSLYIYMLPFLYAWEFLFFRQISYARRARHLFIITIVSAGIIFGVFRMANNKFEMLNSEKAEYLWHCTRLSPTFEGIGNERLEEAGVNYIKDPKGSLAAIARHPFRFTATVMTLFPLRIIAYLETYQFGLTDPIYMVNPAYIANRFASTLEFYFTLFFLMGLVNCIFRRGAMAAPIFMVLIFHIIFFALILPSQTPRLKEVSSPVVYLIGSLGAYMIFQRLMYRGSI